MKSATTGAVLLLTVVAVVHLLRLLSGVEVVVDGYSVPLWASVFGTLVPGALALGVWREHRVR